MTVCHQITSNALQVIVISLQFPSNDFKDCRHVEFKKTIKWGRFNDGFPNLFIENVKEMAGRDGN